jgi:hypothetical protein
MKTKHSKIYRKSSLVDLKLLLLIVAIYVVTVLGILAIR